MDIDHGEGPVAAIDSEEAAINYVRGLINDMQLWRARCDIIIPDRTDANVKKQYRALWTFLVKHGAVVGALDALRRVGRISDNAYRQLNQEAINSLVPTVVGVV